jgi:hypothetical protein
MRKLLGAFFLASMMVATLGLAVRAQDSVKTWTGWISDSMCGAKGMSADHKACAGKCVKEKGGKWVVVETASKDVLNIENQDAVNSDTALGQEDTITGHVNADGTIHIDSIAPATPSK